MSLKIILLCAQVFLVKTAFSQCYGANPAAIAESLGLLGAATAGPAGGSLLLQNSFPLPQPGLSIVADGLIIDGLVAVSGSLPFLGSVALEGVLPTEGKGTVVYGCGNGEVGIVNETPAYGPNLAPPLAYGYGPAPYPAYNAYAPRIEPGLAAAANTAAMAAAANSAGQAAALTSVGLGAAANAAGLTAMAGF